MGIKCFFLVPTTRVERSLRSYSSDLKVVCPSGGGFGYHNASVKLDVVEGIEELVEAPGVTDPRFPTHCKCGYAFTPSDTRQIFSRRLYVRQDTGEFLTLKDAPPGAMWYADYLLHEGTDVWRGPDGHCLCVKCPDGHEWMVDGQCSNCTMPNDTKHKCWVRHGVPPMVSVDKKGLTCAAGAGSIQTRTWHGYLEDGELVTERKRR